ncbi:MAG: thermonuclease family protein [Actinomycetota bacterium]
MAAAAAAALGLFTGCGSGSGLGSGLGPDRATVVDVVDGDTVELAIDGARERVRLLGIDAPESVHPSLPIQCFGPEASAELAALLPAGSVVRVERDTEARDRYDRLLLYLYRADDGLFVNGWLVGNGLADTAFYDPNTTRAAELTRIRNRARADAVGLWGRCDGPDQPLDPP